MYGCGREDEGRDCWFKEKLGMMQLEWVTLTTPSEEGTQFPSE